MNSIYESFRFKWKIIIDSAVISLSSILFIKFWYLQRSLISRQVVIICCALLDFIEKFSHKGDKRLFGFAFRVKIRNEFSPTHLFALILKNILNDWLKLFDARHGQLDYFLRKFSPIYFSRIISEVVKSSI